MLLDDDMCILGFTSYRDYPVQSFDLGAVAVYLEGRLYDRESAVSTHRLTRLADLAFQGDNGSDERIVEWLLDADGDFVVFLLHRKTREFVALTDLFGRLPLYCAWTPEATIISRELRFIAKLTDRLRFDRMAIAQHLLFGYPVGHRTLLDGVHRLGPATCVRLSPRSSEARVTTLHRFNFEDKAECGSDVRETADELVSLFSSSCLAHSLRDVVNVVSLSGGFDSRAVAAGLHRVAIPCRTATFLDHAGNAAADVAVAGEVATLLDLPWDFVELAPPTARDVLKLLRMKNGMNPLAMAFLLPFLERIRTASTLPVVFFTGEIGTFILPDPRPPARLSGPDVTVAYLINRHAKFSVEAVAALTGFTEVEIVREIRRHIDSYPEQEWVQKYVHFVTYERAFKWHSEAEDRNRCYFWSATPFYGIRFFSRAMRCPDDQKVQYRLYREFLVRLSPAVAAVAHAGMAASITSDRFRVNSKAVTMLGERPDHQRRLQHVLQRSPRYTDDALLVGWLRRQIATCEPLGEYLEPAALRAVVERCATHTQEQIDTLFTITSAIEDLTTGASTLEGSC